MLPIPFEKSKAIAKPIGMTDEQCSSLEVLQGVTEQEGWPFTLSCWKPSKEDIEAIQAGRPIWVRILSHTVNPIALFTTDANGEVN